MKKDHIDKFPLIWPDGQATTAGGDPRADGRRRLGRDHLE